MTIWRRFTTRRILTIAITIIIGLTLLRSIEISDILSKQFVAVLPVTRSYSNNSKYRQVKGVNISANHHHTSVRMFTDVLNLSNRRDQQVKNEDVTTTYRQPIVSIKNKGSHQQDTVSIGNSTDSHFPITNGNRNKKNIYFYNTEFFHVFDDWVADTWGTGKKFENCPVSDCIVTKDKKISMDTVDAVIFKPRDMEYCPPKKTPGQVWIFAEFESPTYYFQEKCFYDLKSQVNWTMTYRRDADFTLEHGYFRKSSKPKYNQKELDEIYAKKNKMAVAFISNCNALSKRQEFIKLLQSHGIQVDIFGSCGTLLKECDNTLRYRACFNVSGSLEPDCFVSVLPRYKFFLSFENALCLDYTTEKSQHRVMQHPIVPVIRDGSNRTIFHPPHSYLNTNDYKSVKDLAQHMKMLANNKTAYLEYFKWKQYYETEDMYFEWNNAFCRICERLNNPEKHRRVYRDVAAWHINPNGKQACHNALDLNP